MSTSWFRKSTCSWSRCEHLKCSRRWKRTRGRSSCCWMSRACPIAPRSVRAIAACAGDEIAMGVEGQTMSSAVALTGRGRRVLIIVENLPCPFDRRVWQEARTLAAAGYLVSIICPKGKGYEQGFEELEGIAIYRHPQPFEGNGALGYLAEYGWALLAEFALSLRVL